MTLSLGTELMAGREGKSVVACPGWWCCGLQRHVGSQVSVRLVSLALRPLLQVSTHVQTDTQDEANRLRHLFPSSSSSEPECVPSDSALKLSHRLYLV